MNNMRMLLACISPCCSTTRGVAALFQHPRHPHAGNKLRNTFVIGQHRPGRRRAHRHRQLAGDQQVGPLLLEIDRGRAAAMT